jgi:esterase
MSIATNFPLHYRVIEPENSNHFTPVVFLHGLMGFSSNWGKIWPALHERYPVLVYDQRGHGKSEKPKEGYSPTDYAQDLRALLEHLNWPKVHVVGHSMGGRVALRFCTLFPEKVKSVVIEDSGMSANPKRIQWINELLGAIPTPFADRNAAKKFFDEKYATDPMLGGFLHANLETKPDGSVDWRFYAPGMVETIVTGRATEAMTEFASLKIPTLIIRGGNSLEFPRGEMAEMQRILPAAQYEEISGAGHFVHAEKPVEFSQILKSFLDRVEK